MALEIGDWVIEDGSPVLVTSLPPIRHTYFRGIHIQNKPWLVHPVAKILTLKSFSRFLILHESFPSDKKLLRDVTIWLLKRYSLIKE